VKFSYEFDVDVVGGGAASNADHDGVGLSSAEAERYLVASCVGPRRLRVRERQQTAGRTVATNAETITDAFCRRQSQP